MNIRSEKVSSLIKRILAMPISNLAKEYEAGLATVTSVKISSDLQIASVYLSVYGGKISQSKFIDLLEEKKSYLRSYLGSNIRLRYTPDLRFFIDDTLDQMEHIQDLLDSVKKGTSSINFDK